MAVFGMSASCLAIEHVIISEAVRRAQNLANAKLIGKAAEIFQRTFWVLYAIEKTSSFQLGRSSVGPLSNKTSVLISNPKIGFCRQQYPMPHSSHIRRYNRGI